MSKEKSIQNNENNDLEEEYDFYEDDSYRIHASGIVETYGSA